MATLEQLRSLFPGAGSDSDVIKSAAKEFGINPADIAAEIGFDINKPGFVSDVKRGTGQVIGAFGSTARDLGLPNVGKAVEGYGEDIQFRNPSQINTVKQALSSPLTTAREALGEVVPQIGSSTAFGLGGRFVGGAIGSVAGPGGTLLGQSLGAAGGAYVGNLIQEYGGIRSEQREQGIEDKKRALGTGAAAAALDTAFGTERVVNKFLTKGSDILAREAGTSLLKNVGKQTAIGLGTEALTETGQTALERYGAYKELTGDEALNEYGLAAIKGGIGGGVIRGGLSAIAGERPIQSGNEIQQAFSQPNVSGTPTTNVLPPPPPPPAPNAITPANNPDPVARMAELEGLTKGANGRLLTDVENQEYQALKAQAATLTPPAVTGGTTDIAQQTQAAAAENQQVQEAQQKLVSREEVFGKVATLYDPENPTSLNIFGQNIEGPRVETFGNRFATVFNTLPPHVQTLAQAITQANKAFATPEKPSPLVSFSFNANNPVTSAEKALEALGKVMTKFQIDHVQSLDEAVQILNKLSTTTKGNQLEQLNAIYEAITGQDTDGFTAAQATKAEKGAKDGKLPLQTTTGLGAVSVEGGAGQANDGNDGNVQSSNVQSVGTGSLPAGSLGLQTGQQAGEGIRTGTGADTSVVDGNAPSQVIGAPNEQAVQAGISEPGQPSVPTVVEPAVAEGAGPRVYNPAISYYATDLSHISSTRRVEIRDNLIRSILAPKQEKAGGMTLAQRIEMVVMALSGGDSHADIADRLKVPESTVSKQLQRLGIVVKPRFTEAQQNEVSSIEQRLGIPAGVHNTTKDKFAVSKAITIDLPVEDTAKLVGRLDELYKSAGRAYGIDAPTDGKPFDELMLDAATAYRSPEFPDGMGAGEIIYLYSHDRNVTTKETAADQQAKEMGAATTEQLEEAGFGTIATGGGSQGAVGTQATSLFKRVEKLQNDLAKLEVGTPEYADKAEQLAALWTKYAKQQAAIEEAESTTVEEKEEDAVQEPSAEEVPVRKGAGGGKAVGKGNAKGGKAAGKTEVKQEAKPEEIKTPAEEWADLSKLVPEIPPYDVLTNSEKSRWDDLVRRGQANLAAAVKIVGEKPQPTGTVLASEKPETTGTDGTSEAVSPKFGSDKAVVENPYTAAELTKEIQDFVRADILDRKLVVVDSIEDLLNSRLEDLRVLAKAISDKGAYGVAADGTAYLIANRISKGQGRAKFMHEVGAHLGLENLLPEAAYNKLVDQLERWAEANDGSVESDLANKAKERVGYAETPTEDQRNELLAYFVEEAMLAGIDPTATEKESGPLYAWFRTLWAAFKVAVRKLGFKPEKLTAQDVVNMAYGAARLEMSGSWHGTAASFRKFNHAFMSSGEGAQAYGWGTYLAQAVGIGKGYWEADIERKRLSGYEKSLAPYRGYTVAIDIINPVDRTLEIFKGFELTKNSTRVVARRLSELGVDYVKLASPDGKVTTVQVGGPAGTLMRLDVAVPVDEMIDWDAPFADQPKVVRDFIKNEAFSIKDLRDGLGLKIQIRSGADVLKYLIAKFSAERNIVGEDAWKNATPEQRMEVKREASKYLEANGIHGIRLLDANSREYTLDNISFTKDGKTISGRNAVLNAYFTPGAIVQGYGGPDKVIKFDSAKELVTVIAVDNNGNPRRGERERTHFTMPSVQDLGVVMQQRGYDIGAANRTRNLVIFNEKNILRVGSEAAADKQRMKFGVNAPSTVDSVINALPKPLQKSTRGVVTNLIHQAKRGLYASAITEDLAGMAKKYMPSVTKYLEAQYARQATRLNFEKRIENILAAYDKLPQNLQGEGKGSVNEYIHDSTREKKWGYYPGEQQIGTKLFTVDEDFKKRFDAFPAAAQQVIKDVFRHGHDALTLKQQAAENAVNREFEARIKAAANDADLLQQIAKEKKQMLKRITSIRNVSVGDPYAYLGRYGDYVVVAKSKEFIAYEEAAEGTQARVGADSITGDPQQAKNWLQENVANPMHYVVQFAETQNEADEIAAQLKATGQYDIQPEDAGVKEANASYVGGSDIHLAVARLRNMASRSESTDDKLDKAIADLYLMTVADASARASELQRKNVAGADKNMMRNLATSGRADAHFLATMEHSDEINDSLEAMRNQARNDRREAMPMYNELFIRHANSMNYQPVGDLATALTRMTTLWTLSTNPAFYLQQVFQTSVLSLPFMAGRLGYFRSARAIKRAYGDMSELVKGLGVNEHINFDKAPADVRNMLNTLVGMGKIDLGIDAEAKARTGENGVLGKVMLKLQGVNTRIESINRATAAIAAYRGYLDRYKNGDTAAATKYAADVVSNTHGSYDGFNTPRIMSGDVGRVALQFKRFQIIQLSMLAKLIHTSFKGASADEKAVARASLKFIVAHMAVLGGALGVPFVSQAAWILSKVFGDEDEPDDYEYKLRRMIGDGPAADLLLRGVPAAIGLESLGKKLSMENVASPFGPFVEPDLTSRSGAEKMLVGMMGPAANIGLKFTDALGMMTKGNYYKGLELALPNGVANVMRGMRFANEGITMRNGDLVLKPEDVSLIDAAFQAVGLPTATITDRQYTQKVVVAFDKFYSERAADIKRSYVEGSRDSDSAAMAEAREDWQKLQESRVKNGYKRQSMSELFRAPAEARKRERGVVSGVETTKSNRRFVEQVSSVS